jgi:hypothetical protein
VNFINQNTLSFFICVAVIGINYLLNLITLFMIMGFNYESKDPKKSNSFGVIRK